MRHVAQLLLQVGKAFLHPAPVDFQLGLAGAAPADTAGQPRQRGALAGEVRHEVFQLRQFDLQLAFAAVGVLGKDVENQHGAVDDLEFGALGDGAALAGRQALIEDEQVGAHLQAAHADLVQLAAAEHVTRVGSAARLDDAVHRGDTARIGQLRQFRQRRLGVPACCPASR